mmetsp:Transcript_60133/g.170954  ORF Transcript_60133/g.170954 Transcript_60133/m.170954 type:complete len:238 (+) Transcript_60133:784-1497(+)
MRPLELRRDHVHTALRLSALLRAERRRGAREGPPGARRLRCPRLEASLAWCHGPHPDDAKGEPQGALYRGAGPEPCLDQAASTQLGQPASPAAPIGQPPSLPLAEQVHQGSTAHHRWPAERAPDPGPARDLYPARRERRRPPDPPGAAGGLGAGRARGAAPRPAGDCRGRGLRRQRRHRLHRVPGRDARQEDVPAGGHLLGGLPRLRPRRQRQDLQGGDSHGARRWRRRLCGNAGHC